MSFQKIKSNKKLKEPENGTFHVPSRAHKNAQSNK